MSKFGDRREHPRKGRDPRANERFFVIVSEADENDPMGKEFLEELGRRVFDLNSRNEDVGGYTPVVFSPEPIVSDILLHPDVVELVVEEMLGDTSVAFVDLRGPQKHQAWECAKFLREQGMPVMLYMGETVLPEVKKQYIAEEEEWDRKGRKESHCESFEPRYLLLPSPDEPAWIIHHIEKKLIRHIHDSRTQSETAGSKVA